MRERCCRHACQDADSGVPCMHSRARTAERAWSFPSYTPVRASASAGHGSQGLHVCGSRLQRRQEGEKCIELLQWVPVLGFADASAVLCRSRGTRRASDVSVRCVTCGTAVYRSGTAVQSYRPGGRAALRLMQARVPEQASDQGAADDMSEMELIPAGSVRVRCLRLMVSALDSGTSSRVRCLIKRRSQGRRRR